MANFTAIYESMLPPVNLTDSQPATTDENVMIDWKDMLAHFNQSSKELISPPKIEGSSFIDWVYFFIRNGYIFFIWLMAMSWVVYIIFYHSRVIGYILTKVINYLFIKNGYFKIGSFSLATISGKIMFRNLVYVTEDYSLRIKDGWIIFRYWIPYQFKNAHLEDLSNDDPRLDVFLNGFELHIYNRSKLYSELEKVFNLPSRIFEAGDKRRTSQADEERRKKILKTMNENPTVAELKQSIWRDLFPATRFMISSGRFVFGNHLIPSSLSITFEESSFIYTSRPAMCVADLFTHIVKGKAENMQVILVPSPSYTSAESFEDEPPRFMGDGFIVFRTNKIDIYYYQDEPGFVVAEDSGNDSPPAWGTVIKCGKGTDFSYGPWADRQRDYLYGFFFPSNYQVMPVYEKPNVSELRQFESFDIRLSTLSDAKIDILFTKNGETKALHINAGPGSYLEATIPWVYKAEGYKTHILGQILHLDATTSLQYRPLISSETLEFDVQIHYPSIWNDHQEWICKITACKATVDLIFAHKVFICDLIDDWSDRNRADILKFIPYTWRISIVIKEFELLVLANEFNWIDCSTMGAKDENCKIAVCGEHFDMAFDLPFVEFLPSKLAIKIWIQGECLEGAFYLPECCVQRDVVEVLQLYSQVMCRDGTKASYLSQFGQSRKWKNVVSRTNHWHECMSAPIVALSITYDYFPMPVMELMDKTKSDDHSENGLQFNQTKADHRAGDESLLKILQQAALDPASFDPLRLDPDVMTLELEIGPMNLAVFGVLFRFLWNIKENYLGESQVFSEMSASFFDDKFELKKRAETVVSEKEKKNVIDIDAAVAAGGGQQVGQPNKAAVFDARLYRPFDVVVSVTLHEIQGHLVQAAPGKKDQTYAPLVFVEKLCFELQKSYQETKLQLIISPAVLQVADGLPSTAADPLLESTNKEGFLTLSSLQFRGHAMFSNLDRPIESETLEYAWLVDVEVGEIDGRLTLDQLAQIVVPLENFLFQVIQADLELQPPIPFKKCLHDALQNECIHSNFSDQLAPRLCPYSEDLKYRMVRVIFNPIELYLLEASVAIRVGVPQVKLATCNLHVADNIDGFTMLITDVSIRQFVYTSMNNPELSGKNITNWIEVSSISTGPLFIDTAFSSSGVDEFAVSQVDFIRKHDAHTKRIWFLWSEASVAGGKTVACGCVGNCTFFGCNLDGQLFFDKYQNRLVARPDGYTPPKKNDHRRCLGAKFHDHSNVLNPDYGESLLHPGQFLLEINSPLIVETNKAILNTRNSDSSSSKRPTDSMVTSMDSATSHNMTSSYLSVDSMKPSTAPTTTERFFSAEDLSLNTKIKSTMSSSGTAATGFLSSSASWNTPQAVFSADDVTSASRYYTARQEMMATSSQRPLGHASANTSNATLQKLTSLSSDSSPTLVGSIGHDRSDTPQNAAAAAHAPEAGKHHYRKKDYDTISETSFATAKSDQQENYPVDLRHQLEKPIIESPLLMNIYSTYMSQYQCEYLDKPPPFPLYQAENINNYFDLKSTQALHFERLLFEYRTQWKPKFILKKPGFTQTRFVHRNLPGLSENKDGSAGHFYDTHFVPGIVAKRAKMVRAKNATFLSDKEVMFSRDTGRNTSPLVMFGANEKPEAARSRTATFVGEDSKVRADTVGSEQHTLLGTHLVKEQEDNVENIVVHVQLGEIEIKVTPITLDVLASFISSATKYVARLHPINYLNHLNLLCQSSVESRNRLKKEKLIYLGQLHMRAWKLLKRRQTKKDLNRTISFSDRASKMVHDMTHASGNALLTNSLLVDQKLSLVVTGNIACVNISSLQASLVEELISFSILDRVNEFTCVSMLNVSLANIDLNFTRQYRRRQVLQIVMEQSSSTNLSFAERALITRFFTKKPKKTCAEIDISANEKMNAYIEETSSGLTVRHVHMQLSRLVNAPDVLTGATLTVIPSAKTRVDFLVTGPLATGEELTKVRRNMYAKKSASTSSNSSKKLLRRQGCVREPNNSETTEEVDVIDDTSSDGQQLEHFDRFIMFEAGFEKLSFTFFQNSLCNAVKLSPPTPAPKEPQNLNLKLDLEVIDFSSKPKGETNFKGELTRVWLHFASPPKMVHHTINKNHFTRDDWHLLSCAVPLSIAWVSSLDRMLFNLSNAERALRFRTTSTIACLLANVLNDVSEVNASTKKNVQFLKPLLSNSKQLIRILSPLAKTLQEDASMHIINSLRANFRQAFATIGEFEQLFENTAQMPKTTEMERAIVLFLLHLKENTNPSSPIYFKTNVNVGGGVPSKAPKNQLLALFEEKTKQFNLPRPEFKLGVETCRHGKVLEPQDETNITPNVTVQANDEDYEMIRLLPLNQTKRSDCRCESFRDDMNDLEVCSQGTKNTASENEAAKTKRQQTSSGACGAAAGGGGGGRQAKRVKFLSRAQAKGAYDQFLALPVVRNVSILVHGTNSAISSACHRLRVAVVGPRSSNVAADVEAQVELRPLKSGADSYIELSEPEVINTTGNNNNNKGNNDQGEVRLALPTEGYDPYDSVQVNGRYSSYSNYDKKDSLYWWMVKQQDFMKPNTGAGNFSSSNPFKSNPVFRAGEAFESSPYDKNNIEQQQHQQQQQQPPDKDEEEVEPKKVDEAGGIASGAAASDERKPSLEFEVFQTFESLVTLLGLDAVCQVSASSANDFVVFGTKILSTVKVKQFCIDIDETEHDLEKNILLHDKWPLLLPHLNNNRPHHNDSQHSAFICDQLNIEAIVLKKLLTQSNDVIVGSLREHFEGSTTTNPTSASIAGLVGRILTDLDKKVVNEEIFWNHNQAAIVVSFSVQVGQVVQRINLPLLRLVHQFSAMYENVVQTRFEMRTNRAYPEQDLLASLASKRKRRPFDIDNISVNSMSTIEENSSRSNSISEATTPQPPYFVVNIDEEPDMVGSNESLANMSISEQQMLFDRRQKVWKAVYIMAEEYKLLRSQAFLNNSLATLNPKSEAANIAAALLAESNNVNNMNNNLKAMLNYGCINEEAILKAHPRFMSLATPAIIIAGSGVVKRMNLVAMLSGLKLDGDLTNFGFNLTRHQYFKHLKPTAKIEQQQQPNNFPLITTKCMKNMSVNVSLERTQISLFEEGVFCLVQQEPTTSMMGNITQQLVVKMLVGQSNVGLAHQAETNEEFAYTAELLFDANPIATSGTNDDDNSSAEANIKYTNSARVSIGAIEIDIPQHPVALHGMMTRSSKQLSTTLQELRSSRQPSRLSRQQTMTQSNTSNMAESTQFPPSPLAHAQTSSSSNTQASLSEQQQQQQQPASRSMHMPLTPKIIVQTRQQQQQQSSQLNNAGGGRLNFGDRSSPNPVPKMKNLTRKQQQQQMFANHEPVQPLIPFLVDFTFLLESFTIQASLLPSLRAQYRIEQVSSSGYTGARAKFNIEVNHHSLCFNTKIDANTTTDTNLPTEASINLPRIHVGAEYLEESTKRSAPDIGRSEIPSKFSCHLPTLSEDIVFRKGNFLEMIAEIGAFEHCLTTDLLNHLLFVQKVFMKEVNEVVQKMSRNEPNNFIILGDALKTSTDTAASSYQHWEASNGAGGASRSILFCLHLRMTGIQITATTPTNSAVRFETGAIDLHLSNRVMNMSPRDYFSSKILVQVELDFNVALGQLIRNTIFEEAEPDFQQLAYFKTQIKMRNALRDEIQKDAADKEGDDDDDDEEEEEDKEMVFITLNQPLVYIQPMALDKAVLVWINYRNAYEYWNEQRANLNTEVIQATQQVIDRVQPLTQSLGSNQSVATLFLQLIVNDFGICLPISSQLVGTFPNQTRIFDADGKDALVLTLETTRISACSKDSLVSIAQFKNLCIRFADDFDTGMDDWKPNLDDPSIKNLCIVSEGTYEICSRTITHHVLMQGDKNSPAKTVGGGCEEGTVADAKWILNVSWKMDGFDIHVDTSIGKHISALFKTMTAIAGDEDDYDDDDEEDEEEEDEETNLPSSESAPVKTSSMANILNEGKARPRLLTSHSIDETIDMREKEKTSTSADEDNSVRWTSSDGQAEELLTSSKMPLKKRSSTMKDIKEFNRRPSARTIEKELNEQVKLINDLRQLGASNQTIQQEIKRSKELEAALFNYFRRDMFKKLKRSSSKATATPTSSKKKGDFQKTRAFSTSLYTYREAEWTKDEQAMPSTPAADVVDDQNELGSSEEKVNEMLKIRSSTIPSFRLANEQLMTLSSGDEGSITDIDESQSTSPRTPYTNTSSTKEFDFEPVAGQSHSQPATVHSSPVNHAELKSSQQQQQQSQPTTTSTAYLTSAEPRIDFELDVKIFFNSGQCVLHTKDQKTSDAADASFNRNFSSVDIGGGAGSNSNTEHASNMSPSLSSSQIAARSSINKSRSGAKLSRGYRSTSTQPDFTVFLIPGLDIKLYYSSKSILAQHEAENEQAHFRNPNCSADGGKRASSATSGGGNATRPDTTSAASLQRPKVTKKASLYAWITLSSIPDEICISPHILDFFEEALKPIPITVSSANNSANATMSSAESKRNQELLGSVADKEAGGNAADSTPAAPQYVYYASFPVDVIVFFHFQPTIIQLCCLPVSRVECLLHLPSIDLVMSSKGSDFELDHNLDSPHSLQQLSARTYKNLTKSLSSESQSGVSSSSSGGGGGGLCITGCLADFSLYIFHPYGGQNVLAGTAANRQPTRYSKAERKDSLSLQVEFVKINISRSRKAIMSESLKQSISFSAQCHIGTATFKYDVRRLDEILAFPRAWYRKSIWKKIFIGENTVNAIFSDDDEEDDDDEVVGKAPFDDSVSSTTTSSSCTTSYSNDFTLGQDKTDGPTTSKPTGKVVDKRRKKKKTKSHLVAIVNNPWETLVLLTVNFSKLNISMNMGNIMGNANWLTNDLMCNGSISIDSSGHRKYHFAVLLKNSSFDAKSGIVGGIFELSDIRVELNVCEDKDKEPQHRVNLSLHTLEHRVDYMSTSILMARISDLNASFHDEWRVMEQPTQPLLTECASPSSAFPTKRPASIYIHGSLKWDQMQMLMSKSTSPDFIKIVSRLEEFFTQQFHSGKRFFDSLHPTSKGSTSGGGAHGTIDTKSSGSKSSVRVKGKRTQSISSSSTTSQHAGHTSDETSPSINRPETIAEVEFDLNHHRHWQKALEFVTGIYQPQLMVSELIPQLVYRPPGIILGGTVEVRAQNISLACFYGVDFKSKSWGVFSLRQPSFVYMTEAQRVKSEEGGESPSAGPTTPAAAAAADSVTYSTHVVQNLSLLMGRSHGAEKSESCTMATVSKISRTQQFAPQFRHLHEWFHYAFSKVNIDDVNRFPLLSVERAEFDAYGVPIEALTATPSQVKSTSAGGGSTTDRRRQVSEFHFKEEMIFAFPSLQMELKTEHLQSPNVPTISDSKPKVYCSFMSDFDDHIYVGVDAEGYFFLHDLISSYINDTSSQATEHFRAQSEPNDDGHEKRRRKESAETGKDRDGKGSMADQKKGSEDEAIRDYRRFVCKDWHLEPTVRLYSWAGKNIDPYGVDYILQKLGFNQARTTIPKYIQRSTMDAIDKAISVVVYSMIRKSQEDGNTAAGTTTTTDNTNQTGGTSRQLDKL